MKTLLKPAMHTLWQALLGGVVAWYGTVNLGEVHNVTDAKRLAVSGLAAAVAALASGTFHALKLYGRPIVNALLRRRVNKAELFLIDQALDTALAAIPAPAMVQHITVNYPEPEALVAPGDPDAAVTA